MQANHALQRTRHERRGCKRTLSWAGSLSLGSLGGISRHEDCSFYTPRI